MKNMINKSLLSLFLFVGTVMVSLAQGPPPPLDDPGILTSLESTSGPTGAPIPDGILILLVLAAGYGIFKYFQARRQVKTA